MECEPYGVFLNIILCPDRMPNFSTVNLLKLVLGCLFLGILGYNFYLANNLRYEAEGDAAAFISLGTSLAKIQKYGHLEIPEGVVKAFQNGTIASQEFKFRSHSTWRPPVWPLLIAFVFILFGYNLTYLLIFKILLHVTGTYIFYRTLKLLKLQDIIIIIGVFLYGASPAWQLYSRVFLSEPITLFIITLWIFLLILFLRNRVNFVPQAIIGGILVLSHPYYLFLPFTFWLILLIKKQLNFEIFILSSIIGAFIISTWIVRNFVVLDANKVVLTTSSGAVMAKGWNKNVPGEHTNTKGDLADETLVLENYVYRAKERNEVEQMQLYKDATVNFIHSNPELILPITAKKLKSAFNPFPETPRPGLLETGRWVIHLLALFSFVYVLFFSQNKIIQSLVIGLVLSTIAITILTYSGFRFRMPQTGIEILVIVFACNNLRSRRYEWAPGN